MPRCQRTFRRLPPPPLSGAGAVCPYCPDHEGYTPVPADADLWEYARAAYAICLQDFRPAHLPPLTALRLWLGLHPECIHEPDERVCDLYLQREGDALQCRLQIGHEIFHAVCSQGHIFHWTHEMLACLVSVRLLRHHGHHDYAHRMEQAYQTQAESLPLPELLGVDPWGSPGGYPPGYYGRAFVTGQALEAATGWEALAPLARSLGGNGQVDTGIWLRQLSHSQRRTASGILNAGKSKP